MECYCKFRSSKIDTNGFIKQEEKVPVQATSITPPTSGGGLQTSEIFVLNSLLQHENNQNLEEHLKSFYNFPDGILPLTHRSENYKICKKDSDFFSVFNKSDSNIKCVKITLKKKDGSTEIVQKCNSWRGVEPRVCIHDSSGNNTGFKNYEKLELFDFNNVSTGIFKDNIPGTSGYIAPIQDLNACPLVTSTCDVPVINSVTVDNASGKLLLDYSVTTSNLATPEYQVSLNNNFTAIIDSNVGYSYTQQKILHNISASSYTSLYIRVRKHCTKAGGTAPSNWSTTFHWINQNQSSPGYDFNPVNCIPGDYQTPSYYNPQGTNNYSICTTGNQFTKNLKIDTATPQAGTQLLLMDGVTKAIPGNLSSFDGTNGGNGTNFNLYGIRWVRFINGAYAYKVYDVESSTGKIIGESQTFNCN